MEDRLEFWIKDLDPEIHSLLISDLEHWLKIVKRIKYVL